MSLFSRRRTPPPDQYRYDVPERVRSRILNTLSQCVEQHSSQMSLGSVLEEVGQKLYSQYGGLRCSGYEAARVSNDPVIEHFFRCTDEEAMDFIELCFQTRWNCGGQPTVDAINRIFEEDSIGYELTPLVEIPVEGGTLFGRRSPGMKSYRIEPPRVIRKDEKLLHSQAVQPCLQVLSDPRFATANTELLKAFEDARKGRYADAITSCGSAFESVLKTICDQKGWPHDPDKDTCSKLLEACKDNGLFPPFYKPLFEATGTIRNKLGDAHGRGPSPQYAPSKEFAEHMLHQTCSHVVLLVSLAKI